jgi:cytochrome c biogenesis protein CcmG/thiol:disulfide interchange protein DsbE
VNRPAPDFALPGLYGDEIRLSDYEGKVVLVNFWGTWCEPCKEETPALQEIHERLGDEGLVIIGIDLRNQERAGEAGIDDVRRFVEHYQVTYPIALDTDGAMARAFQIYPIPTSYFIDPNGTIRYVRPSTVTAEEVEIIFHKLKQTASALR